MDADTLKCDCGYGHEDISADNLKLRRMLAIAIAGAHLYGDDGELQDSTSFPYIDFLRDSPDLILKKLEERAMKKMLDNPKR